MNATSNDKFAPVWPGPRLLVPITLDVLLVGEPDRSQSTWAQTRLNYYNLWNGMLPDAPAPFGEKDPAPPSGAHLMWTLPFALRRGQQAQQGEQRGEVAFPLVPNRWLIFRGHYDQEGTPPALTAGVLQSDHFSLVGDLPAAVNQYPDPDDPENPVKRIGRYVELAEWDGPAGPSAPFLKAVGPGDVSWAVAYDNVNNVFAFHDDLPESAGTYSYSVIGWYARPADDPLFQVPADDPAAWKNAVEAQFQWSVGRPLQSVLQAQAAWQAWQAAHGLAGESTSAKPNFPSQLAAAIEEWQKWQKQHGWHGRQPALPRQMICHGMLATVTWQGRQAAHGTGAPEGGRRLPKVAVGNTATEAIAAWLADLVVKEYNGSAEDIPTIERAVEAFQKDVLFELESDVVGAEALLHQARFSTTVGGREWIVIRPEGDAETGGQYGGQQSIPLTQDQTALLSNLNQMQAEYDQLTAELVSQRWELFANQFKQENLPRQAPDNIRNRVAQALAALKDSVKQSLLQIGHLQSSIAAGASQLRKSVGDAFVVKAVDLPGYHAPNDPVVMIGGSQLDTKLARPGAYDNDEMLFTRYTGQTVSGIQVDYALKGQSLPLIVDVADVLKNEVTLPAGRAIPKEIPDLWLELLFLDISNSKFLANCYFKKRREQSPAEPQPTAADIDKLTEYIRLHQTVLWNDKNILGVDDQTMGMASGLQGVPPSKVAVEFWQKQPWTPIYLDWKVKWFPSSEAPDGSLKNWQLEDIDYKWTAESVSQPATPHIFVGRTILNPKVAQDISAKLATFVKQNPDYANLPDYVRTDLQHIVGLIVKMDILTQSLSGFTEQLLTKMIAMNQTPRDDELINLLGKDPITFRPVTGGDFETSQPFYPIRAGHCQIVDLWIVDSFGQILRGKDPALGPEPLPEPLRAESTTTPGETNKAYIQLPPRIAQPARVDLRFLKADDDGTLSNSSDLTSPICGWVMPNHLDDSLMVFDAAGVNLGAVLIVQRDIDESSPAGTGLRWEAAPGSEAPLGAPPQLPNPHLQRFITALLRQGLRGADVLNDFLDVIDASLWRISPLGVQEGNLSVLLGRPIAVVRAEISLNLYGLPDYNQAWIDTGKYYLDKDNHYHPTPPPFVALPFPVRVGDLAYRKNGVLGYFEDNRYETFYAVYGAAKQTAMLRQALKQGPHRTGDVRQYLAGPAPAPGPYVATDHLIQLPPNGSKKFLTLLVDPRGSIPVITGCLPSGSQELAPGPATQALQNMKATFRVGPILTDPRDLHMPIPAEIKGKWAWLARRDVTSWGPQAAIKSQSPVAGLEGTSLKLSEGWLTLSGAEVEDPSAGS